MTGIFRGAFTLARPTESRSGAALPPSSASHLGERRPATSERLSPAETAAARPLLVHHDAVTARPVRGRFRASSSAPLSDRSALNTAVALPRFEVIAGACVHSGHPLAVPGGSGQVGDPHVSPACRPARPSLCRFVPNPEHSRAACVCSRVPTQAKGSGMGHRQ